ncbi:MAG: H-X9-DG-CTERM domain-containing protein [Candidatus Hydrogenedentales bacterium]
MGYALDRADEQNLPAALVLALEPSATFPPGAQISGQVLATFGYVEAVRGIKPSPDEKPHLPTFEHQFSKLDSDISLTGAEISALAGLLNVPLTGYGNGAPGSNTIYRLREGVERFMVTDINNPAGSAMAQSELPVMADLVATSVELYNHVPGGGNVLFMDGHVEFIRYPGTGLASEAMAIVVGVAG